MCSRSFSPWSLVSSAFFRRIGYPLAPLVFGLLIGRSMEQNLRRALALSQGSPVIFLSRPLCLAIIALTVILLFVGRRLNHAGQRDKPGAEPKSEPRLVVGWW